MRCEATVVHVGSRTATSEGRIVDANGKVYAHGTTTCIVVSRRGASNEGHETTKTRTSRKRENILGFVRSRFHSWFAFRGFVARFCEEVRCLSSSTTTC